MLTSTCVSSPAALSDEQLVSLLQRGGPSAASRDLYQELFQRHYPRVTGWCLHFSGERESALDMAQEVFLRAYRNLDKFRGDAKFSTWLYTIARNQCLTVAKRSSTEPLQHAEEVPAHLPDCRSVDTVSVIEREQSLRLLWQLVADSLDDVEIQVMTLHYGQEVPLEMITRLLHLSNPSGAKAYIVSGRRKLSAAVQAWRERQVQRPAVA